jgi:hypothetical protein
VVKKKIVQIPCCSLKIEKKGGKIHIPIETRKHDRLAMTGGANSKGISYRTGIYRH